MYSELVSTTNHLQYSQRDDYVSKSECSSLDEYVNSLKGEGKFKYDDKDSSPPSVQEVSSCDDSSTGEHLQTSWASALTEDEYGSKSTLVSDPSGLNNSMNSSSPSSLERRTKKEQKSQKSAPLNGKIRRSPVAISWDLKSGLEDSFNTITLVDDDNYYKKAIRNNLPCISSRPDEFLPLRSPPRSFTRARANSEEKPSSDRSITTEFTSKSIASDFGARAYNRPDDWVGGSAKRGTAKRSWRPKGTSRTPARGLDRTKSNYL